jgi:hypothetical protein
MPVHSNWVADGRMPYERLWWRVSVAKVCPLHRCRLLAPLCSAERSQSAHWVPKRAGVCANCGSIGHKCQVEEPSLPVSAADVWVAEQVRQLIAALPEVAVADHLHMKDQISHYCTAGDGRASLARRSNMTKSQMSYWLRNPAARTSLAQLLDICLVEQFSLAQLLLGDLSKAPVPGSRQPRRVKRASPRVDHGALRKRLETALEQGKKVSEVACEAGVDISTVAKHEKLYLEIRERTQDALDAADTERRRKAVEEAEAVIEILVPEGLTPSLRAASELTGTPWYPAQLRAQSLMMLRVLLGDRRVTTPARMAMSSYEYRALLHASSRRLTLGFGVPTSA